jgi:hypothetical protein
VTSNGQQPAIDVLQYPSAGHRRLLPYRMFVRKHLTLIVDLGAIVRTRGVDVEVVSRHDGMSCVRSNKLNSLEAATVPTTRVWTDGVPVAITVLRTRHNWKGTAVSCVLMCCDQ